MQYGAFRGVFCLNWYRRPGFSLAPFSSFAAVCHLDALRASEASIEDILGLIWAIRAGISAPAHPPVFPSPRTEPLTEPPIPHPRPRTPEQSVYTSRFATICTSNTARSPELPQPPQPPHPSMCIQRTFFSEVREKISIYGNDRMWPVWPVWPVWRMWISR